MNKKLITLISLAITFFIITFSIKGQPSVLDEEVFKSYEYLLDNKTTSPDEIIKTLLSYSSLNEQLLQRRNQVIRQALVAGGDPNKFLRKVMTFPEPQQRELIIIALENGADPNRLLIPIAAGTTETPILLQAKDVDLLFNNSYQRIDPNLFCRYLRVYGKGFYETEGLYQLLEDETFSSQQAFKHLNAKATTTLKVPKIIHHIWLTNINQKREIPADSIENILHTKKLFLNSNKNQSNKWQHIVWTNDKSLIPWSVQLLEKNGIQVIEITEIEANFKLQNKLKTLIEEGLWGMASDVLRYELLYYIGGVYADLDFRFVRSLEVELYKYNFLLPLGDANSFFFASKQHPILYETLCLIERNFNMPPEHIAAWDQKNIRDRTYWTTALPLQLAYNKAANLGTIDVRYPNVKMDDLPTAAEVLSSDGVFPIDDVRKYLSCNEEVDFFKEGGWRKNEIILFCQNNICGTSEHYIGKDMANKQSWAS